MKLIFLSGSAGGSRYSIEAGLATIGRDASNDICVADPSVSLVHCQISVEKDAVSIKDLGSTNGTRVNDQRVINATLRDGDSLQIGKNRIRIEIPEMPGLAVPDAIPTVVTSAPGTTTGAGTPLDLSSIKELSGNIFGEVSYFLKRKIADGGMGSIYEAEQYGAEGFIKKVAIKTILPVYVKKDRFVSAFVGEAKLVANLVHQNIVQIHHLGRHDNGYYIAMEYIDGITLTDFMIYHRRLHRLPAIDIATFIISRICRGLEYAHSKTDERGRPLGLVHRDVSPSNVMITHEGEVKLTDFGVAKAAQFMEADEGAYLVGSVEYMSPEQAACEPVDSRSDLFSLGLLYHELLTGHRVFQCKNDDIDETVERVKSATIPDPRLNRPEIAEGVFTILMKCLEKKAEHRFQAAGLLGDALEHEMYSRGMGPTIVTLARYVSDLRHDYSAPRHQTRKESATT